MALVDLISGVLSGGVTGLLGAGISRWAEFKTKKLEFGHEARMKDIDLKIMAEEWSHRTQVASIEAGAKMEISADEAFAKSSNEPQRYSDEVRPTTAQGWVLVLIDAIRALVRPGLTFYLAALTTYLYWDAHSIIGSGTMMGDDATLLVNKITDTVLYLCTVCVTWYFGVRTRSKEK